MHRAVCSVSAVVSACQHVGCCRRPNESLWRRAVDRNSRPLTSPASPSPFSATLCSARRTICSGGAVNSCHKCGSYANGHVWSRLSALVTQCVSRGRLRQPPSEPEMPTDIHLCPGAGWRTKSAAHDWPITDD